MGQQRRVRLFDDWARQYDRSVASGNRGFPFEGYERVLDEVVRRAAARPPMGVLDLATGTGNLAARFVALGCAVWGLDFSSEMLAQASEKLPGLTLVQADLAGSWPAALDQRFDRIVSAYALHHLDLSAKVRLLRRLADQNLDAGGRIVVGDVAFPTVRQRRLARSQWVDLWDEDEYYWAADEAIATCTRAGLEATYAQVSTCGGVFVMGPGLGSHS